MSEWTPARIKRLRKALDVTQEQFAPMVGKEHKLTISRWERGVHPVGRLEADKMESLEKLARDKAQGQRRASRAAKGSAK
jgi:transcriptional regulator with XRE-family HTH domain